MCYRKSGFLFSAFLLLVFLFTSVTISAQSVASELLTNETTPSAQSSLEVTPLPSPNEMLSWDDWEQASKQFADKLEMLSLYWEPFALYLEKLGVSLENFPAYIDRLSEEYASLQESSKAEREAANAKFLEMQEQERIRKAQDDAKLHEVERSLGAWRVGALSTGTAAILLFAYSAFRTFKH